MFRNKSLGILTAAFWMVLAVSPQPTLADTVDNPGPFTVTAVAGHIKVGSQRLDFDPLNPPSIMGMVDSGGNVTIPTDGVVFPDMVIMTPLGDLTVRIVALSDSTGILNPITGNANITTSLRVQLIHSMLPPGCGIGPINPFLTTGDSGGLTGVPYDETAGTATYVSNDFSVPGSNGCGGFGGLIDNFLGIPSDAGNNEIEVDAQFDPVFTGS